MNEKQFSVLPNNVVWDNQLNEVVCRCILEGIGDAENVCQRLNELLAEKEYFERKKEYFLNKWSIVHAKNIQLRQEIKELKEENEELISTKCTDCELINLQTRKIDSLEKENKMLKKENRQMAEKLFILNEKYGL